MDRFVGMFAFAIPMPSAATSRGPRSLRHQPLYYARSGSHLLFASEIKALMGLLERPCACINAKRFRQQDAPTVSSTRRVCRAHSSQVNSLARCSARAAYCLMHCIVRHEAAHRVTDARRIVRITIDRRVTPDLRQSAGPGSDDRAAACHRLDLNKTN